MDGDGKPASTDEECTFIKQKGFMSFEDCFNGKDDNNDGMVDCDDPICAPMPKCGGTFNFIANANDKKSPTVIFQKVDEWPDGAFVKFDTDEPAKGILLFYRNDSSCITLNKTLEDLGDPSFTFDDYKPFHGIVLEQNSLGYSLEPGIAYYYKTKVMDPSNNTAQSACLNFTTKSEFKKVLFDIDLDPGYEVDFMCNGFNKTDWNGTYAIKLNTSMTRNCNMTIKCDDDNYQMTMVGVDINQPKDIDLQDKLVCDPDNQMVGMDSDEEVWHEVIYGLSMGGASDYIQEEFPFAYDGDNKLYQCNEDTAGSCSEITDYAECSGNSSKTTCKIPTSVGYSGHILDTGDGANPPGGGGGGGGSCTSQWDCSDWTSCVAGQQTRTCTDTRKCAKPNPAKPAETQACNCYEDWSCSNWKPDDCKQGEKQTRTCEDWNKCGTTSYKPATERDCPNVEKTVVREKPFEEPQEKIESEITGAAVAEIEKGFKLNPLTIIAVIGAIAVLVAIVSVVQNRAK
jgi:hypothetical protein